MIFLVNIKQAKNRERRQHRRCDMTEKLESKSESKKSGVMMWAKTTWNPLPRVPSGTLLQHHTPPTYSSHDVILKWAAKLLYITAYSSGQTARDKTDECFSILKVQDINYWWYCMQWNTVRMMFSVLDTQWYTCWQDNFKTFTFFNLRNWSYKLHYSSLAKRHNQWQDFVKLKVLHLVQ